MERFPVYHLKNEDEKFFNFSSSSEYPNKVTSKHEQENLFEAMNKQLTIPDYLVTFSTRPKSCCVGIVDMVNSTKISSTLSTEKVTRYYEIFLNSMSKILNRFGGFVIKNVGDCLLYYFPETSRNGNKYGFLSCLECSLTMVESHELICRQLVTEGLPCLDYRISADYGAVVIMQPNTSSIIDMIGPPVNICTKINRCAKPNGVVIGGDLYEVVRSFPDYQFKAIKGYSVGFKFQYPVYAVSRRT